jgi:hypothetical protein
MLGGANRIHNKLGAVASGLDSCNTGLIVFDLHCAWASVSLGGSISGSLFYVWRICVLEAAKKSLVFAGLVDGVTSGRLGIP